MRELISHPVGTRNGKPILLYDHLNEVAKRASHTILKLEPNLKLVFSTEDIALAAFIIGICHDFGKAKKQFQDYIWGEKGKDKDHAALSSIFTFIVAADVFKAKTQPTKLLPFVCAYTVNRHHGPLINIEEAFREENLEHEFEIARGKIDDRVWEFKFTHDDLGAAIEFGKYHDNFLNTPPKALADQVNQLAAYLRGEADKAVVTESWLVDLYFGLLLVVSSLTESDPACVIDAPEPRSPSRINSDTIKSYAFSQPKASSDFQSLREKAWEEINSFISQSTKSTLRLTLPTGLGKTLMGLYLSGQMQKETSSSVIYALPYLSIIEQATEVARSVFLQNFSEVSIIQYHSLSFPQEKDEEDKDKLNFRQARFSLENWDADLVITTFDQLFYSFLSADRGFIKRFFRLPGSICILDEVQTLPARLIPAVQILLQKMCEKLNLKILYMTATHPPLLKNAQSVLQDEEKYFRPINRTQLKLNIKDAIPFTKYLENLPNWLRQRKDKSILLVANTIRSSLKLFDCLNTLREQNKDFQDIQLFYLSGNVVPVERIKRISEIKQLLNTQPRLWFIVVSTQCVEAGVDIDMDEVVRDFGPWDSIMQVCGRANRFGSRERATVWIYRWLDDLSDHGREFHSYIYDSILTDATSNALSKYENVEEGEYLNIQKHYTQELEQILSQQASRELIKHALSWQFDELDFRRLFRGDDKAWKISLFCIADDTADKLKDITIELWSSKKPKEALKLLEELCENLELFLPLEQFLRIKPQDVKQFINELKSQTERQIRYQLPRLLNPMFQAYTISISVRSLEGLSLGYISEGFPYASRELYEVLCGFSDTGRSEVLSNII